MDSIKALFLRAVATSGPKYSWSKAFAMTIWCMDKTTFLHMLDAMHAPKTTRAVDDVDEKCFYDITTAFRY